MEQIVSRNKELLEESFLGKVLLDTGCTGMNTFRSFLSYYRVSPDVLILGFISMAALNRKLVIYSKPQTFCKLSKQ